MRSALLGGALVAVFGPTEALATDWYVRPSGGTGAGTSWTAAWNGLSAIAWSSVSCGDTVWVAGGTYGQTLTPAKVCTSGAPLAIRRARSDAAACTTATGWFADLDATVHQTASLVFGGNTSFVTVSGRTTASGGAHGWWIDFSARTAGPGIEWPGASNASYNTIEYIDVQGPGYITYSSDGRGLDLTPYPSAATNNLFSHMRIWNWESGIYVVSISNTVFEYIEMYGIGAVNWATYHPNGIYTVAASGLTIRYSTFHSNSAGNGIGEGIFCEQGGGCANWLIYGNVFVGLSSKIIQITSSVSSARIFNNTFANCDFAPIQVRSDQGGACAGSSATRNNLFYSSNSSDACGTVSNNLSTSTDPFASLGNSDFHIVSVIGASYPRDAGADLSAYFSTDADGATFGGDGAWDIGAYEYVGSCGNGGTCAVPQTPSGLTATVR